MIILAIETSGSVGALAILREGRCVEELFLPELSRRHAQTLVPELMDFLRRHGMRPRDIDGIAVSIGPGGFTGLRVGVSCAKTLAYASGARLVAVDTFEAIAENTPAIGTVAVIADAQRRGVLLGILARAARGQWERTGAFEVVRREELGGRVGGVEMISGPGLIGIEENLLREIAVAPRALWLPRAAVVARLGEEQLRRGKVEDPMALEPHYARRSAAEEQRMERG